MSRGFAVVYITHDPADPQVTAANKRRFRIDAPQGKMWVTLVTEYLRLKKQLDYLEDLWDKMYKFKPRQIDYPLQKKKQSILTEEFFINSHENMNPVILKNPIEYNGRLLRSKNELLGCRTLEKYGLEYKTEIAIGDDPYNTLYPDLTFNVPYQQRCISIEINGALNNPKYANKSLNRQSSYIENGLMIGKDVIFLDISDKSQYYAELLETQIRLAILAGLDDIVFPHGYYDDINSIGNSLLLSNQFPYLPF